MTGALKRRTARRDRIYNLAVAEFLGPRPRRCEARIDHDCSGAATQVHHRGGRDERRFMDRALWSAVCTAGHNEIHAHPTLSYESGDLIRRNSEAS